MEYFRWRSLRRFVRARNRPSKNASHLDQAEDLLQIADAFGVAWPSDRRRIELRLGWLGFDRCRSYHLSDVIHLVQARPKAAIPRRLSPKPRGIAVSEPSSRRGNIHGDL